MALLQSIHSPQDLKQLNIKQLKQLCEEIRTFLVEKVAVTGGHLAPSLGVVELTVALHYVFDAPEDDIVFDVGHQAYVHKILTGRMQGFDSLRQQGGISGFPRVSESEYDAFSVGHASTAISAALGMARTHKIMHDRSSVVAVVGDGALTGGMCYEALNDAGRSKVPLIVILNDNAMSISRNVGALSGYLSRLRHSHAYHGFKRRTRNRLMKLPVFGQPTFRVIEKIRDGIRAMLTDGAFFDSLGFEYWGPLDGHDIKRLIRELQRAKETDTPVLMHVCTVKGKGYLPAEQNPSQFHGCGPFDPVTGVQRKPVSRTSGEIVAEHVADLADMDIRIVAITAAMEDGTGLKAFAKAHPDRFFDVGIAEEHAVTMAAGMASRGLHPYVAIYSTFLQRSYDQLMMDVCLDALPVTLLIDRSGLNGADGVTHQGVFDISYLQTMPNMIIASPRDIRELQKMINLSAQTDAPMAIRYGKEVIDLGPFMNDMDILEVGTWEKIIDGKDVMILATGRMVQIALQASVEANAKGLSIGVIDARFLKPIDLTMLREETAVQNRLLVTLEDNVLSGGLGSAVNDALTAEQIEARVLNIAVPDRFIEHAAIPEQLTSLNMDADGVIRQIEARLKRY